MLFYAKTLRGYKLNSFDGELGKAKEFYFDDRYWAVRYLVADTGNWLTGKKVLISPYALVAVNIEEENIDINLTKKEIENSPSLDSNKPVSKQFEEAYYGHYGWPAYWGGPYMWASYPYIVHEREKLKEFVQNKKEWDPDLRSTQEVTGYHVQADDGEIGHIEDFIIMMKHGRSVI
jgi:hypothetical protein